MKSITKVFKDLMTPDSQSGDWYSWATNQMAHAFLGACIAVFAGAYWLYITIVAASAKEVFDLMKVFNFGAVIDSLTDIFFWLSGAGIVSGGQYRIYFLILALVVLCVGIYFRLKSWKS